MESDEKTIVGGAGRLRGFLKPSRSPIIFFRPIQEVVEDFDDHLRIAFCRLPVGCPSNRAIGLSLLDPMSRS